MGSESVTSEEGRRTRTRGTGHNLRNSRPEARQAIIKVNKTRAVKNSSDTSSKSEGYKNQRRRDHWHYQELVATPIRKHFLTVCQLVSDGAHFFKNTRRNLPGLFVRRHYLVKKSEK